VSNILSTCTRMRVVPVEDVEAVDGHGTGVILVCWSEVQGGPDNGMTA
jgi:hypothetical protein